MTYPQSDLAKGAGLYTEHIQGGETIPAYSLVYLNAAGRWMLADADLPVSSAVIGLATEPLRSGQKGKVLNQGYANSNTWAWTPGATLYVSSTAGGLTETPPASIVVPVATAVSATLILFDPATAGGGGGSDRVTEASYIVWTDGTTVYAKNGLTGHIDYSGTDWGAIAQSCHDVLTDGGRIHTVSGEFNQDSTLNITNSHIIMSGNGISTRIIVSGTLTHINIAEPNSDIEIVGLSFDGTAQAISTEDPVTQKNRSAIYLDGSDGVFGINSVFIRYCYFYNTSLDAVYGNYCGENILVDSCSFYDIRGGWAAVHTHGGEQDWEITNCYFWDCIAAVRHARLITDNVIIGQTAIQGWSGGTYTYSVVGADEGGVISGNYLFDVNYGIQSWGYYTTISDNYLRKTGSYEPAGRGTVGILIAYKTSQLNTHQVAVIGNSIYYFTDAIKIGQGAASEPTTLCTIQGNTIYDCRYGVNGNLAQSTISDNTFRMGKYQTILDFTSYNTITGNTIWDNPIVLRYTIAPRVGNTYNVITDNVMIDGGGGFMNLLNYTAFGAGTIISDNIGYVAPSEERTVSGSLTAGVANAIGFAWHNPEAQDILIKKVVVEVTTAGGTGGSHLDVGIADDAAGTNRGTEFFDDLLLNTAQVDDSWVAGDGGTQTKWVFCEDSASATDGWIVGQILDANAASLVGKYYITYVGR